MPPRCLLALALVLLWPDTGFATSPTSTGPWLMPRPLTARSTSRTQLSLAPRLVIGRPLTKSEPFLLPPVSSPCISSPFGPRILPNRPQAGTYHYGVDLPAPEGAPVKATAPGQLIRIQ